VPVPVPVSHELRMPLNGMLGMIQIMKEKIHDAELKNYLSISRNSRRFISEFGEFDSGCESDKSE